MSLCGGDEHTFNKGGKLHNKMEALFTMQPRTAIEMRSQRTVPQGIPAHQVPASKHYIETKLRSLCTNQRIEKDENSTQKINHTFSRKSTACSQTLSNRKHTVCSDALALRGGDTLSVVSAHPAAKQQAASRTAPRAS